MKQYIRYNGGGGDMSSKLASDD